MRYRNVMSRGSAKSVGFGALKHARAPWLWVIVVLLGGATALGLILRSGAETVSTPQVTALALSPSRVLLAWSNSYGGGVRYRVFRNGTRVAETVRTFFTDIGLRTDRSYRYRITALDSAGQALASLPPATVRTPAKTSSPVYPLKIGPTRRYLVDQRGVPFMIIGDSPQALIVNLSAAGAEEFLANRRAAGFNSMWVNLLCIVCSSYAGGRADGTTYDGIPPFKTPGDFSTPNEAYFARVDRMIGLAEKYGIVLFLNPIETAGWLEILRSNGVERSYAYGRYLGERYRRFRNIVWFHGNDFQSWADRSDTELVQAVARGIEAAGSRQPHTVELNYPVSSSLDDESWRPLISLDAVYTYAPTYAELLKEYNRPGFLPTVMIEANYEFEALNYETDLQTLRRQEYWSMLSGASGQFYGNKYTWQFLDDWRAHLDTPGSRQMTYATKFFAGKPWFRLVPDQHHRVVRAGYGTFAVDGAINDNDYVTAASTPDGKLAIAYLPETRTITVDLGKLSGPVLARWYDPTKGTSVPVSGSPFPNPGVMEFRPPGQNGDGDGDWVLDLTAP
jgi:hypothetical protein